MARLTHPINPPECGTKESAGLRRRWPANAAAWTRLPQNLIEGGVE